jgi:hypothetical protein
MMVYLSSMFSMFLFLRTFFKGYQAGSISLVPPADYQLADSSPKD